MWRCKECGEYISVLAIAPTLYKAYLDKNKKVVDYEDYIEIDFTNAKITKIFCEKCKKRGNLENIAEWLEE